MGNRAVITWGTEGSESVGVYLHWNGSRSSVRAFLDTCKARGYRSPANDPSYAMAGLVAVIQEFFGATGLSVGVDVINRLDCDNMDNGVYQVGEGWQIVDRWGEGSMSVELTMADMHGRELEQYEGIMAQLARAREPAAVVFETV